jgi:hypothetical protein
LRGKNELRLQKLNLALVDEDLKVKIFNDIVLSPNAEINFKGQFKAIIINHDE